MTPVVGVDGGGTRTRAVIVDHEGRELGRAESRGALASAGTPGAAAAAVSEAVRAAASEAGAALPATGLWAGLAGAGAAAARLAVQKELAGAGLADRVVVGTDAEAAFRDAFGDGPGILLIAGTGSIAWARGPSGEVVRVGGWGERLGDEGSGFAMGRAALRAVVRAEDGRGAATELAARLLSHLGLAGPEQLVSWAEGAGKGDVAALAPIVASVAADGDRAAARIVDETVAELSDHLGAAVERAGPWPRPPELALWGGLLQEGGALAGASERIVAGCGARLVSRPLDPAMGAARLALAQSDGFSAAD